MKYFLVFLLILSVSCNDENSSLKEGAGLPLFVLKDSSIGIAFENNLAYDEAFNPYVYRNFYNGGGVAIGDVNNDGLEDVYLTGNMVDNKLFLNKGNWQFEDITNKAGVSCTGVWSTGATFADINGDGYLDLYVCKSGKPEGGNRHNELFINDGPTDSDQVTFTESSKKYGLDVTGLSVHASFFDYDKDGDLDVYVLNNSLRSIGGFDLIKDQRNIPDTSGNGNKFFRNDGNKFTDITLESGIYASKIGFGLGITLGDFNNDDWTDIFISNDFFERDYLYINDTKGKFIEQLEDYFGSISMGSMGADLADLNNDKLTDLIVTEMLPASDERQKTKALFESWDKHQMSIKRGYFNQFPRNTLQRNLGNGAFLEVGRQADIAATEWSWGALAFDMDNDGLRDIFISNGIYKDLLDRDYLTYDANEETIRNRINSNETNVITKLIDTMPSQAVSNSAFQNMGDFLFKDKSEELGLAEPSFSNGSAYGDLDNDGDLDLVVNNVNMPTFIYENTTDTLTRRSITFRFIQKDNNTDALGTKATIKFNNQLISGENYASRGFQSSVPPTIHLGVGNIQKIDSLEVKWPSGAVTIHSDLETNKTHNIVYPDQRLGKENGMKGVKNHPILEKTAPLFDFVHQENSYIDFDNERLLPQMYSNEGPALAIADINNDSKDDFFLGGAKNQSGKLFLSTKKGYSEVSKPFDSDSSSEDTAGLFFDADQDGDKDLYVCHGGKAFSPISPGLNDTFYRNDNGVFIKEEGNPVLPNALSSSVAKEADFDNDGDLDVFVGERYKTNIYGEPGSGYILENDGKGNFKTIEKNEFKNLGMITDARWLDINSDGWQDLIVLGEWMPIKIFINKDSHFKDESKSYGLDDTAGLWTSMEVGDIDGDGDLDIIAGNIGLNNFLEPKMRMYVSDFDRNGFKEQIVCKKKNDKYYPIVDKDELIAQIPSLKKKLLYYKDYAVADMETIFSLETLKSAPHYDIQILESMVFYNENGRFIGKKLPNEIQYAPIYSILSDDIDNDGNSDLIFGGNQYLVKPQFGRYDASMGWAVLGPFNKTESLRKPSSLNIQGQIRNMKWVNENGEKILIVALNNEKTSFYKLTAED